MPYKYVLELVADYLAAGRTYRGKGFTFRDEYDWWMSCKDSKKMHEDTKDLVTTILYGLAYANNVDGAFKVYRRIRRDNELFYKYM
jgi:pentatricopeptide repeat protein